MQPAAADCSDTDVLTVAEFAARHRITRAFVYLLWKRGDGPRFMRVGSRRLISHDAAEEWRRSHEIHPPT